MHISLNMHGTYLENAKNWDVFQVSDTHVTCIVHACHMTMYVACILSDASMDNHVRNMHGLLSNSMHVTCILHAYCIHTPCVLYAYYMHNPCMYIVTCTTHA